MRSHGPRHLLGTLLAWWTKPTAGEAADKRLLLASPLFDPEYYVQHCSDLTGAGGDPVIHYLRRGWIEGKNPSAKFDGNYYLVRHPDVRASKYNPLVHYLRHGRSEGRAMRATGSESSAPKPRAPTESEWNELIRSTKARAKSVPIVDVIIPAFRGFAETANCVYKALRAKAADATGFEIIVVDDASPERELSNLLDRLADAGVITLLRNAANAGFVASVNKGMKAHEDRDVILLNSDTEVFGNWVERLHRTAYSTTNIGTVTPFSNNATICSYPNFPRDFDGAFEVDFEELDQLASEANAGLTVEIPTAVGFCMYIRRECLREVGLFDAAAFGLGYGEENDFCKRISARGWRNVLTGDVFVRHLGRVSFQETTDGRVRHALEIINTRYPGYNAEIAAYIKHDPPKAMRRNLDLARIRRAVGAHPFLFVLHNLGGGTERHVRELSAHLAKAGTGTLLLRPNLRNLAELDTGLTNLSVLNLIDIRHGLNEAAELFRDLGMAHIHVHHTMGFAPDITHFIESVAERCGVPYDVTLHDYLAICPRIDMIDASGVYCGNPDIEGCESCIQANGSPFGDVGVSRWRAAYHRFLLGARKVFVPDEDVTVRLTPLLPDVPITVRPHPETVPETFFKPVQRNPKQPLRVAVIGAIGRHKGSNLLLRCAEDALTRRLPIKFVLFGFTDKAELKQMPNVEVTGAYKEADLQMLLARSGCHLSFFPAVWPETYSYTLSQAFFSGLYPVAFDIGALARRIRQAGWGHVLPFGMVAQPAKVNEALLSLSVNAPPSDWKPVEGERLYRDILKDYYELEIPANEPVQSAIAGDVPSRELSFAPN
jgi:GT2 family glycosyltransferase/glycosyltransferase involved in cell wall biosynthesis